MSYNKNLSQPKDVVRFLLGDNKAEEHLSDEEIYFLLSEHANVYTAAGAGALQIAGTYTDKADKTVGPLSIKYGEHGDRWRKRAEELITQGTTKSASGGIALFTGKKREPAFTIGMGDHPSSSGGSNNPYETRSS